MYVLIFPVHFILMYDKDTMRVVKQDSIYRQARCKKVYSPTRDPNPEP